MESFEQRVKRHEGFVGKPKPDAKGGWVGGWGHELSPNEALQFPDGISEELAQRWLDADLDEALEEMHKRVPWANLLIAPRQEVVQEMVFQLGIGDVLQFKKFATACQEENWLLAAYEMVCSDWHVETRHRCEELAEAMRTGAFQQ